MTGPRRASAPAAEATEAQRSSCEGGYPQGISAPLGSGAPRALRAPLAEVVDQLTIEQLDELPAIKRARQDADGPSLADEEERLAAQADPATAAALVALRREPDELAHIADLWRAMGVDDALIAAYLVVRLVDRGKTETEAQRLLARAGVPWSPRSSTDRWRAVALWLFDCGLNPEQVERALADAYAGRRAEAA